MLEDVQWLFLDVGSTLVDERAAYEHRLRDIACAAGRPYAEVYETALRFYKQNRKGDQETARHFGVALPAWHEEDEVLYPDTVQCLQSLHRGYKIGIIANQKLGTAERLKDRGILQYIDLVIASAEEGVAKPDKRIFEIALRRAGCKPENAVMIGDRVDNDIVPAKEMGIHTVWVKQGFGQYWQVTQEKERAEYTVASLREICDIL